MGPGAANGGGRYYTALGMPSATKTENPQVWLKEYLSISHNQKPGGSKLRATVSSVQWN